MRRDLVRVGVFFPSTRTRTDTFFWWGSHFSVYTRDSYLDNLSCGEFRGSTFLIRNCSRFDCLSLSRSSVDRKTDRRMDVTRDSSSICVNGFPPSRVPLLSVLKGPCVRRLHLEETGPSSGSNYVKKP